jgi:hypothetical protein
MSFDEIYCNIRDVTLANMSFLQRHRQLDGEAPVFAGFRLNLHPFLVVLEEGLEAPLASTGRLCLQNARPSAL